MSFTDHPLTISLFDAVIGAYGEDLDQQEMVTALSRAGELGLFAPVYRYLKWRGAPVPVGAAARWRRHVARVAMIRHEIERVASKMAHMQPIFLKGDLLSEELYGERFLRETGDIDLLIEPSQIPETLRLLGELGYHPDPGTEPWPWVVNQYPVYHQKTGLTIELHWGITFPYVPSPAIEAIMAEHRLARSMGETEVHVLHRDLLFLHLCFHFQQHSGFLKGLVDIAGWIDRFEDEADLDAIRSMARDLGVYGLIQWPLHALREITGKTSALYDPSVDPFITSWAAWTASTARGALLDADVVPTYGTLAFKTQDMLSGHKMLWTVAGMMTLDGVGRKAAGVGWLIFRNPAVIAAAEGKEKPTASTYVHMICRPGILVVRQAREVIFGESR
ncbi:MAG: nucleotidyltransferase family protein [Bradymonadaceae bacterium]